jgi:hypothetical protein
MEREEGTRAKRNSDLTATPQCYLAWDGRLAMIKPTAQSRAEGGVESITRALEALQVAELRTAQ